MERKWVGPLVLPTARWRPFPPSGDPPVSAGISALAGFTGKRGAGKPWVCFPISSTGKCSFGRWDLGFDGTKWSKSYVCWTKIQQISTLYTKNEVVKLVIVHGISLIHKLDWKCTNWPTNFLRKHAIQIWSSVKQDVTTKLIHVPLKCKPASVCHSCTDWWLQGHSNPDGSEIHLRCKKNI